MIKIYFDDREEKVDAKEEGQEDNARPKTGKDAVKIQIERVEVDGEDKLHIEVKGQECNLVQALVTALEQHKDLKKLITKAVIMMTVGELNEED